MQGWQPVQQNGLSKGQQKGYINVVQNIFCIAEFQLYTTHINTILKPVRTPLQKIELHKNIESSFQTKNSVIISLNVRLHQKAHSSQLRFTLLLLRVLIRFIKYLLVKTARIIISRQILIETSQFSFQACIQFRKSAILKIQLMGGSHSDQIKIATVNFSGITDSPFEFQSSDAPEITKMNAIFKRLFHQLKIALEIHQSIFSSKNSDYEPIEISSKETKTIQISKGSTKKDPTQNITWRRFNMLGMASNQQVRLFMAQLKKIEKKLQKQTGDAQQSQQILKEFDWGIKHLDKTMHKGRYCIQYRQHVGIQNGRFNSMLTFFTRWKFEFEKNKAYSKLNSASAKKQRNVCMVYDYLIYKTIVEYCYNQLSQSNWSISPRQILQDEIKSKQIKENTKNVDIKKQKQQRRKVLIIYEKLLEKYHQMPCLKHQKKYLGLKKVIDQNEITFLQDISDQLLNALKGEGDLTIANRILYNDDCCIVINNKRSKFQNVYDVLKITDPAKRKNKQNQKINAKYLSIEDFNYCYIQKQREERKYVPAISFIDNFLFISLRFTSQQEKCYQVLKFFSHMLKINDQYPSLFIVIGGDFNVDLTSEQQIKDILKQKDSVKKMVEGENLSDLYNKFVAKFYISNANEDTTKKKRSWLQSQSNKAGKLDKKQRDFLISNREIFQSKIDGKKVNVAEDYLPSKDHPFDHYFLLGKINKNAPKKQNIANR